MLKKLKRDHLYLTVGISLAILLIVNAILILGVLGSNQLTRAQIKKIAYGDILKSCLEDSESTKTTCLNTKIGEPELLGGRDGEIRWIVDGGFCYGMNGEPQDSCNPEQPE